MLLWLLPAAAAFSIVKSSFLKKTSTAISIFVLSFVMFTISIVLFFFKTCCSKTPQQFVISGEVLSFSNVNSTYVTLAAARCSGILYCKKQFFEKDKYCYINFCLVLSFVMSISIADFNNFFLFLSICNVQDSFIGNYQLFVCLAHV